jgi:hypothetical protein
MSTERVKYEDDEEFVVIDWTHFDISGVQFVDFVYGTRERDGRGKRVSKASLMTLT